MNRSVRLLFLALLVALVGCSADWAYRRGVEAFDRGDWKKAIRNFGYVSAWNEHYPEAEQKTYKAYFYLGKEALNKEKWDKALTYLSKLRKDDEDYQEARQLIGELFYLRGREAFERREWAEAIKYLNIVRVNNRHYEDSRVLAKAAREELEKSEAATLTAEAGH
jgi:tetratricopeptide (TPR) repeat protein